MKLDDINMEALLRRLHLANTRRVYRELCTQAEKESWSYRDFLAVLVTEDATLVCRRGDAERVKEIVARLADAGREDLR